MRPKQSLTPTGFNRDYLSQQRQSGVDQSRYGPWQRRYGNWLADSLQWRGADVLDVGCSCGNIVAGLVENGVRAVGVDINEHAINLGRLRWRTGEWHQVSDGQRLPNVGEPPLVVADAVNLHQFGDGRLQGLHTLHSAECWRPELVPAILAELWRVAQPDSLFFGVLETVESVERNDQTVPNLDLNRCCLRPFNWWIERLRRAGWELCREDFRMALMSHGRSMFHDHDWDWWLVRKVPRYEINSQCCVQKDFHCPQSAEWADRLELNGKLVSREWDYTHIAMALDERGLFSCSTRGLRLGIGQDPLVPLFAERVREIHEVDKTIWADSSNLLNQAHQQTGWRSTPYANGTRVATDGNPCYLEDALQGKFDFAWSVCATVDLNTVWQSQRFILNSINCVKPSGWCLHTVQYSLDPDTAEFDDKVYFTEPTLRELIACLKSLGHRIDWQDRHPDDNRAGNRVQGNSHPDPNWKLIGKGVVATNLILIIQRGLVDDLYFPLDETEGRKMMNC